MTAPSELVNSSRLRAVEVEMALNRIFVPNPLTTRETSDV